MNPGIRFRVLGYGDSVSCANNGATGLFGPGIDGLNLDPKKSSSTAKSTNNAKAFKALLQ
jgi:hypothetical protein